MFYRKKVGKEGSEEVRREGREERRKEGGKKGGRWKCPGTFSAHTPLYAHKINVFPSIAFLCPRTANIIQLWQHINTAATYHFQFLYLLTVYSSPKIFFRKSEKEKVKIFCSAAALGILN